MMWVKINQNNQTGMFVLISKALKIICDLVIECLELHVWVT